MKLATWNVNSIRARQERVLTWVQASKPDVLCLQELKCVEEQFPSDLFHNAGYHVALAGQKTYNGVAILSRVPVGDVVRGLGDEVEDPEARLIAATINGVRILSAYVPNGQAVGSEKFCYKLKWLTRLRSYLDNRCSREMPLVIAGDFNIAPTPLDVHDPTAWEGQVLFTTEEKRALENVRAFGLVDTFRLHHPEGGRYTWWDYRQLSFPKNRGLRIDHVFATEQLANRCIAAEIDREARKGQQPSDHAPVVVQFSL